MVNDPTFVDEFDVVANLPFAVGANWKAYWQLSPGIKGGSMRWLGQRPSYCYLAATIE
jgi:hypothetical protein